MELSTLELHPLDLPVCAGEQGQSAQVCSLTLPGTAWHWSPAQGRISAQELSAVTFPTPAASMGSSDLVTPISSRFSQQDLAEHSL